LLGVAPSEEHKAVLRSLGNGECIYRDLDDRAGRIGIDLVSDELRDWIDTNPTRGKTQSDLRSGRSSVVDAFLDPAEGTSAVNPSAISPRAAEASSLDRRTRSSP
jgi:hypothetical protein